MAYQLKYEESYAGKTLTCEKQGAQIMNGIWGYGVVYGCNKGNSFVLSGYAYYDREYTNYLQTVDGWFIPIDTYKGTQNDWSISNTAVRVKKYTDSDAQRQIWKIIHNGEEILRCNLLCARYANRFSKEQLAQIKAVQLRLQARNEALQVGGFTENVSTGKPSEYAELSGYLDRLMSDQTIGVATWVVVVIAATIIAGMGAAVYFTVKNLADESERDVKYSKELTASLVNKLTEEEYQQLLKETKNMLTKSKIKALVRGSSATIKLAIAAVGAYAIYKFIKERRS